jgi:hypothetical protein
VSRLRAETPSAEERDYEDHAGVFPTRVYAADAENE